MALVYTSSRKDESYLGFAQESTFATELGDGANYTKFDVVGGEAPAFDPQRFLDIDMRSRGKNMQDMQDLFTNSNGIWQRYELPETLANADVLANMMYAVCQTVSEAVGSPYLKTYTMDGATGPLFSANGGYFFSFIVKNATASHSTRLSNCVLESLTVRFSGDNGGRATISGTILTGQGYTDTANPGAGTIDFSSVAVPSFHTPTRTLTLDSIDLVWRTFELNITNTFDWIGNSTGLAEDYKLISQAVTVNMNVKYDTNSDVFMTKKDTDVNAIDFDINSTGNVGHFGVACSNCLCTSALPNRGDDNTIQTLDISLALLRDDSATENVVITVSDGVDQAW